MYSRWKAKRQKEFLQISSSFHQFHIPNQRVDQFNENKKATISDCYSITSGFS